MHIFRLLEINLASKTKMAWTSSIVKTLEALEKLKVFILPFIRQQHANILDKDIDYQKYKHQVEDLGGSPWDSQVIIPLATFESIDGQLLI